jgi:hypothetical protein
LHVPVALNFKGEFFAAVIAAQSTGWPKLLLGARNMRKSTGAHHNPPASARQCSTLDLRFVNPQPCFQIEIVRERCPKSTHQDNESGYFI